MEWNLRGDSSVSQMTINMIRPRFTRTISMTSFAKGKDNILIYVITPERERGTSFLKSGNEIWTYVPNVGRTIRMPITMMAESWMGTDFTHDDLVKAYCPINDFEHRLLDKDTINNIVCYIIEMIPLDDTAIPFGKILRWVSVDKYLPIKVQNFDSFGEIVSSVHFNKIKKMSDRYIPTIMKMIPEDKPGYYTIMEIHEIHFNRKIDDYIFSVEQLPLLDF